MFEDIKIIKKDVGVIVPEYTFGWYFKFEGGEFSDYWVDKEPTGETYTNYDDCGNVVSSGEVCRKIELTEEVQIRLIKTMLDTMKRLAKNKNKGKIRGRNGW